MPIVTSTYRYKPPPRRKRKLAEITGPVIVTPADPKKLHRPATRRKATQPANDDNSESVQLLDTQSGQPPSNRSAIVTARRPGKAIPDGLLPDTPEEHQRRGDAADALWRELVRRANGDG